MASIFLFDRIHVSFGSLDFLSDHLLAILLTELLLNIIIGCIFGAITKRINENKGYYGGFAWGFWLWWIGIIVVACRRSAYGTPEEAVARPEQIPHDSWKCKCGRYNAHYVSSCVCGSNKMRMEKSAASTESQKIALIKEYSQLLDSGIITQEEFDAKKKELLGL